MMNEPWPSTANIAFNSRNNRASRGADSAVAGEDFSTSLAVYKAALKGDWETAYNEFGDINKLCTTIISSKSETALHVAVSTGKEGLGFVKKLVESAPPEALGCRDRNGDTALHVAAVVGNKEAAAALVGKNPDLLYTFNHYDRLPVQRAAISCRKKTLEYLISQYDEKKENNPFEDQLGVRLLIATISSQFLDVALKLVQDHEPLALLSNKSNGSSALSTIADMHFLFPRTEYFSWWQKIIYNRAPIKKSKCEAPPTSAGGSDDIENLSSDDGAALNNYYTSFFHIISRVGQKVESMIWNVIQHLVPEVKELREKRATREQAIKLAEFLCQKIVSSPGNKDAATIFKISIMNAARNGISEIVEMILDNYPGVAFEVDNDGKTVFMLAASNRFENIINLIYKMSDRKYMLYDLVDYKGSNLMHLCGELAPSHRLNLVAGAALQMQRELQWFKEMESFVHPSRRMWPNVDSQTAQMIFTEKHRDLKEAGEKWMKDTANACTISAALIATVVFAGAFTVPGGLESDTGMPLFSGQPAFVLFAVSDALSLFTSITSLLMFLSILTSRYAEEDFLYRLPRRLCTGLFSLFVSITFMMVAFSATMFLVFRKKMPWLFIPVASFACLPVASFVLLQFPLLRDVLYSTYGPGIFYNKTFTNKHK